MSSEIEPSRDPALWKKFAPEIDLILAFLPAPAGALIKYAIARLTRVLESAEEESGETTAVMLTAATKNEALADLVQEAFDRGQRTRVEKKLKAYGRAIARGYLAIDDAEIDSERFVVRAIDSLEQPHIAAIEIIAAQETAGVTNTLTDSVGTILNERFGGEAGSIITRQLANQGLLAGEVSMYDGGTSYYGLSEFGKRVREHMIDAVTHDATRDSQRGS